MKELTSFLKALRDDPRISTRNRIVLAGLVLWLVSPIDLIPDWIPVLGQLDDAIVLLLILEYLFVSHDSDVILDHWPWPERGFHAVRAAVMTVSWMIPERLRKLVFSYAESAGRRVLPGE